MSKSCSESRYSSPEAKLAIACLGYELGCTDEITLPDVLDWGRFYQIIKENRLAPHFAVLEKSLPISFPEDIKHKLKLARYQNLLHGDQCKVQVYQVLAALKEAGIPVIVLKGWAVIQWLYGGDHGQRSYADFDILIPPDFVDHANDLLIGLDYAGSEEFIPGFTRRFNNSRAYALVDEFSGRNFSIGLHWGLIHFPYVDKNNINISKLFERAILLRVAGISVLDLSFDDQLIYNCAHLALHHRNEETLLNYFEIAAIIQRMGAALDWKMVLDRSRSWRYLVQVQHVLREVQCLWPELIPADRCKTINEAPSIWMDRGIDHLVAKIKGNPYRSALLEIIARPGWRNKVISAFHQIFPRKEYMVSHFDLPVDHNFFWLYAMRIKIAVSGIFKRKRNSTFSH